ncbi:class I SAM-dependent methyltransferase [Streptomyces sp. NRRL B-1347]|uniref:class I SAM-dependent methyltransferase n=1 Tax=Streptomyces sp. NRRL B-1347 TaxID=1476877 RepID=UPI00131E68FB|nr:class I SAM-dependent methyltransferase [Streptomyces sp. NRRL B-1347]
MAAVPDHALAGGGLTVRSLNAAEWDRTYDSTLAGRDEEPPPVLGELLAEYAPPPTRVLDVGCGLGTTARRLAGRSYTVTACDFSARAIQEARRRTPPDATVRYETLDVTTHTPSAGPFPVVLDRGVLHTCPTHHERRTFAAAMARMRGPNGLWLHVGAAALSEEDALDQSTGPSLATEETFLNAVAPWFTVLDLRIADFGHQKGVTDWPARDAVLRRREG